jgi:hypothetical protein
MLCTSVFRYRLFGGIVATNFGEQVYGKWKDKRTGADSG